MIRLCLYGLTVSLLYKFLYSLRDFNYFLTEMDSLLSSKRFFIGGECFTYDVFVWNKILDVPIPLVKIRRSIFFLV